MLFDPEDRTAEAAAKRREVSPLPLYSSYVADLNDYRVTQDMLRHPSGLKWDLIVHVGSMVRTSYDTGPYVVEAISEHEDYGVKNISLVCSLPDAKRRKDGKMSGEPDGWLNEIVAVDGRLLELFKASTNEIIVLIDFHPKQNVQVSLL
ncbi:MAG: hypothetical protein A2Z75_04475 [Chloroflexi bacterium RBG_13_50_10]|nr:MAG: hypothetical protein A2Z75_04475 [Chloroflexi bacterium RBG_13_50_10]